MKISVLISFGLIDLAWGGETSSYWKIGQTVQTNSGLVHGHAASRASQVSEYLGIPYADAPIGQLRFAPPQRFSGNGTINGTAFGFSCPLPSTYTSQLLPSPEVGLNFTTAGTQILNAIAQVEERFSEDCLTLNIWTKPQTGERKKAVLLWIHGGGYIAGSSNAATYDGARFADREDVVIVSINYRLNIFGFPGVAGVNNLGLLDQRLAVEWVRDNIAAFGGDPHRITLFGESAGGGSVDLYAYAWTSDPIVAGFIAQSGTVEVVPPNNVSSGAALWSNASSILGCENSSFNAEEVLRCMRTKDFTEISKAISGLGHFVPTVDEQIVFSDYPERSLTGKFIKKPLLIGHNDYEAGILKITAALRGITLPDSSYDAFDLKTFYCPAAARANASASNNVPTWRYRYFGDFPNMQLSTTLHTGAYHGAEVNILFDTIPTGESIPASTPAELEVASYMRSAWSTFAKDPVKGLNSYQDGWPQFDPAKESLIRLAYDNKVGTNLALPADYDANCSSVLPAPTL